MTEQVIGNYLRAHRKKSGLSQRELAILVGYVNEFQISRHERSVAPPPFLVSLAYSAVFGVSVAEIFTGFHSVVTQSVWRNLEKMKTELIGRTEGENPSRAIRQKLQWLLDRTAK